MPNIGMKSVNMNRPNSLAEASEKNLGEVSSFTEQQKEKIGAADLNAVANKAADKNWVDTSKRVTGHGNSAMDKDAFFKLMIAQLKNQDPMNPLKNHEMAAQLAQFSTLEQMTNMNTTLGKIEGQGAKPQDFQALNLIGKTVAGDSSRVVRSKFDKEHDFNFNLPEDAAEANVKVMSAKGDLIREYPLSNIKAGANKVSWNGKSEVGTTQPEGEYLFQVEAKNNMGRKISVKTEFEGTISGINFSAEGPVLQVGNQAIKMRDVRQITDSSAKLNDQNVKNLAGLDLKNTDDLAQTNIKQETNTSSDIPLAGGRNVMTDVAMSRELMNKLQKEMK